MRFKIIFINFFCVYVRNNIFSRKNSSKQKSKNSYSKKESQLNINDLEIFNKVFNNLNNSYVDSLDHRK